MSLKSEIVGSCELCEGAGFEADGTACECMLKFRSFNRLIEKGFFRESLALVSSDSYQYPEIANGEQFVKFFYENPQVVEDKGLSLFIHSKEKGRGKTTLTHSLVYTVVKYFSDINLYKTERTYRFIHIEDLLKFAREGKKDEIWQTTWLVIDDLGNEDKSSDWKVSSTLSALQRIIHYRRDRSLPTLITSNYTPSDLSNLYKGDLDSLMEIGYDGEIKGIVFREIEVGGGEDFRTAEDLTKWPI